MSPHSRKLHSTDIVKVRIDQTLIKKFPFDLVYLVPVEQREVIPHLFPWSLCFTITPELHELLEAPISDIKFSTRYPAKSRPVALQGSNEDLVQELSDVSGYFLVVPVLGLEQRRRRHDAPRGNKIPAYLTALRHAGTDNTNVYAHLFTPDTILFSPDGAVRPICRMCPRSMLNLQGKCHLGSTACYTSLVVRKGPKALDDEVLESAEAPQ
jgi:hypothetical protein